MRWKRLFKNQNRNQSGFTLIELLLVISILAILLALSSINLAQPQVTASLDSTAESIVAELKGQQQLAMSGDQGAGTSQQPQGIYIQSTSYTTFAGSSYSAGNSTNFSVPLDQGITMSTTLPSTQVVFNKGPGDVSGYVNGSNTITLTKEGSTKTITITRYGAVSIN